MGNMWGTSEWVLHPESTVNKGFGGMWGLFWNIQLIQRREQLSQRWLSCSRVWDSCSQWWDSCSGGKVVGLSQKRYDFSESGTTFWWEQLSHAREQLSRCCISCCRHRESIIMFARGCTARVSVFKKTLSLSHSPIYRAFQALSPLLTFHKRFTPVLWKRCETSGALRARRNRLQTPIYRDFSDQRWKWKIIFKKCPKLFLRHPLVLFIF